MTRRVLPFVLLLGGCGDQLPGPHSAGLALPERFRAVGTEPFWAASVAGNALTYATPENQGGIRSEVRRSTLGDKTVFTGTLGGAGLRMVVAAERCSDGMSDLVYPYSVELTIGTEQRQGCAGPEPAEPAG